MGRVDWTERMAAPGTRPWSLAMDKSKSQPKDLRRPDL
jgi:hypothetical protein